MKTLTSFGFRPLDLSRTQQLVLLGLALVVIAVLSAFLGRYPEPGFISLQRLAEDQLAQRLFLYLRLPRILSAVLLGMTLGGAGAVFQLIFGNPLVEPGFLGVSQGAAFGAAFSIIFLSSSALYVQGSAGIFALLGLGLSYGVARRLRYGGWVLRLVLSGIAVSALFSAGLGVLKYLADPLSELQEITFWLLGGLWSITWQRVVSVLLLVVVGLVIMFAMRWRLNLLSLSDQTAHSLGVWTEGERVLVLVAATLATASMISISGIVGWVGLIIPHVTRRIFGADARYTLPGSILAGALFTLICDNIARAILPGEIPLGIVTSLIGAVAFLGLMMTQRIKVRQ